MFTFYRTGTEVEVSELGELLEQVVGYIDANSAPINHQTVETETEEEEENAPITPHSTYSFTSNGKNGCRFRTRRTSKSVW